MSFPLLILSISGLLGLAAGQTDSNSPVPVQIPFSKTKYGPDGPWQAVTVNIGSPDQPVDLYPGGAWQSGILSTDICKSSSSKCPAQAAGLYDSSRSTTADTTSIALESNGGRLGPVDLGSNSMEPMGLVGHQKGVLDQISWGSDRHKMAPDVSIALFDSLTMTYPGGSSFQAQLGSLSLGAPKVNQTFSLPDAPPINASLIPSYLWQNEFIPSNSFGMHIGSAPLNIPGSLFFGGYDKSRVLGDVASFSIGDTGSLLAALTDIGIGVEGNAGSPFSFSSQQGLLAKGNSSIGGSIQVNLNPLVPYMFLPKSTCDAITQNLPVTYNSALGLYFWNTSDRQYERIVSSTTFLQFNFSFADTGNLGIKVPFKLLNLTLGAPLVNSAQSYFPCRPYSPPSNSSTHEYHLGRAFLQAAFIGINWKEGNSKGWLAQAPGPNGLPNPSVTVIDANADEISSSAINWAKTWDTIWTPLGQVPSDNPYGTQNSSGGLSTGAKAGIGAICGLAGILAIIAGIFFFRRRSQSLKSPEDQPSSASLLAQAPQDKPYVFTDPTKPQVHEAPGTAYPQVYEAPGPTGPMAHELPSHI
ncbi:hypothetical protein FGG08_003039 [Glutinoglossum americanum]|uniref:Peptidase A1 domain-containing protein n=1 Tax=Glutinoglossum americanum TaxID=1670608 RepID=A0A9P8IDZ3_9PEZI|nr:hypothetical protein FGG08_003039 [Glutinoglossum americanum]